MRVVVSSIRTASLVTDQRVSQRAASFVSMEYVIETHGLERSFGDVHAVRGVDLAVSTGEIYGFLGPNGAGKSTVVKMLTTLLAPTGGTAQVLGHDIVTGANEIRLRIGAALQEASLDNKQSGREILQLQGALYGLSKPEINQRIDELSTLIEFDAIDRWIREYSGGMKRRLDLAASLMHNPDLLFLDEPTTGLDPTSRVRVWEEVRALKQGARHNDLSHNAIPRGSRRTRRPGRHHQRRTPRRRGHARGAQAIGGRRCRFGPSRFR